mgnify:CR=1 FL=1
MTHKLDLVVIGTGSAGNTVALACRDAGWSVGIVDSRPFGGTCQLRGCDPKKVLVGAAELADWARRMSANGVTNPISIDWPALMKFKRTFTDPVPATRERAYRDAGIATFHGRARCVGRETISVDGETLHAKHIAIAAGARPEPLHVPGEEHLVTSDQFLELDALPREIIFVGGGYVAFEFAHVVARAGSRATIVHRGARPLEGFDRDLVAELTLASREAGITIELDAGVRAVERVGNRFKVHAMQAGSERSFECDLAVHSAGRVPDIADLGLDTAGVATSKKGVLVNQYGQSTTNAAVYAAGDAADSGGLPLTPVAGHMGEIIADNLIHGNRRTTDFSVVPSVVYSIPALATVGLSEDAADRRRLRYRVARGSMAGWYSTRRIGATHASFKTLIEEASGKILGAHLLGPHVEEQINVIALTMRLGAPATLLREMLFAYPTPSSDLEYLI